MENGSIQMSKLSDATKLNTSNVFLLFLNNGGSHPLLIAKCSEVDNEKMLVTDPYHVIIMIDEQGNKSSVLLPFTQETLMETTTSFFDYKDIMTIYAPKEDFANYYLANLIKAQYEKLFADKEDKVVTKTTTVPAANNEEKVIHVDFKAKKRKPANNQVTIVTEEDDEKEPDPGPEIA